MIDIRDFGAKADGKSDDSKAIQAAMDAASAEGGGCVRLPWGKFLLGTSLSVPANVILEGELRSPVSFSPSSVTGRGIPQGSMLLAGCGEGKGAEGEPLLLMHQNSVLNGLIVHYPDQKHDEDPVPYPWTVRGIGDNCTLQNLLLINPYRAIDFGTYPAGRHYLNSVYAGAIYRGLFIDQCYDVGRVENVHFWPFWEKYTTGLKTFIQREGVAFVLGRTDWEYLTNCFCIGYRVGFHFTRTPAGSPNALLTQCGSDVGPTAVRVSSCMEHAGISFVNGQFMAGIETEASNAGPVKFTACGFWPVEDTDFHARLQGTGHTTFNGCHFSAWARRSLKAPAIDARAGGLTVSGCDFMDPGKTQIRLGPKVEAALIYGNRFRGGQRIDSEMGPRARIDLNAEA
jgi:hypothetical protein